MPIGAGGGTRKRVHYMRTGTAAFDEMASEAGGLVRGISYLLSGYPGSGKSTLSLQAAAYIARSTRRRVVYGYLEEGEDPIEMRMRRLGLPVGQVLGVDAQSMDELIERVGQADLVIFDSVQKMRDRSGVAVETLAEQATDHAHATGATWLIVGQVTKEGEAAGAEQLQHNVDATLWLSGDKVHKLRVLGASKNRWGPTDIVRFLRMTGDKGLVDVPDASSYLLADRVAGEPGSCVAAALIESGSAAVLCEVQALLTPVSEDSAPRISARGVEAGRIRIVQTILAQRAGFDTSDCDVVVSVTGELPIGADAGLDLPIALAMASSLRGRALPAKLCAWGELGLVGEVRAVSGAELRRAETKRAGFEPAKGKRLREVVDAVLGTKRR